MKQGGTTAYSAGFTIVEVMIVLAISTLLMVSALLYINGRQAKTEFVTAINGFQQQLQEIISAGTSGYYQGASNFNCAASGGSAPVISGPPVVQSGQCIFIGNALRFGGYGDGTDFTAYPLVSNRFDGSGKKEVTSLSDAHVVPVAPGNSTNHGVPNDSVDYHTENGLAFLKASFDGGSYRTSAFGLALLDPLGEYSYEQSGTLESGSSQFGLFTFNTGPKSWGGVTDSASFVDAAVSNGVYETARKSVALCMVSGTTNQSAVITIGSTTSSAQSLAVSTQIFEGKTCGS